MTRAIWRLKRRGPLYDRLFIYGFIAFFLFLLLLAALTSPPQYRFNDTLGVAIISTAFFAMYYIILRLLPSAVEVRFTEDGLVVRGRRGFTVPRDVVVSNNVVCIRKSPAGLRLHVIHGLVEYSFPLSQRQYDELINALSTYWGWEPPECPRIRIEVGPVTPTTPETPEASAPSTMPGGVLWRWSVGKYNVMFYIVVGVIVFYMLYYIVSTLISLRVITEGVLIALAVMFGLAGISARWTYRYYKRRLVSDVRSITLTYDGFTITDRSGNTFFISRDDALDSICVGGTTLMPPIGNVPPTGSNIEYVLLIDYNGVTYRVPMLRGEFNRLQEVLSRAWGRSIRGC
ncbi:MAG: hypothetical protein AT716_03720 [Vulcanisaeta sp. MG_3]|jgi:hypothetical protein|nr:MAG: hypothetical protein AT716_03720 [Vulcanisaeta sp. MG_3]